MKKTLFFLALLLAYASFGQDTSAERLTLQAIIERILVKKEIFKKYFLLLELKI